MNRGFITLAAGVLVLLSCSENNLLSEMEQGSGNMIEFTNYVSGHTRASHATGASFVNGDTIQVFGVQIAGDGTKSELFRGQSVTCNAAGEWSYTPARYWEQSSTYDFYAIYPYSAVNNSFDFATRNFSIQEYSVSNEKAEQQDIMIAARKIGHKPGNLVSFEFNHILSNVGFYIRTSPSFDATGIESVEVLDFDVTGLYSTGSFAQTGWNGNTFDGTWTANESSTYDLPRVQGVNYTIGATKPQVLAGDLLLLPQTINPEAELSIKFKLVYSDGTESKYERTVKLNTIVGQRVSDPTQSGEIAAWEPNLLYNYIISVDPSKTPEGSDYYPIANPDKDQDDLENQDPENPVKPTVNIIPVDTDDDGEPDEWWIDDDMDGEPDYPIIWKDIDGDGKEEATPDRDGDGVPDDSDGDGNPDVIWIDTDDDGVVDTELERDPEKIEPEVPVDPTDPEYPTGPFADYNGGEGGYDNPTGWIVQKEDDDESLMIDTDGDGIGDIPIIWKDIDGDGKLEGVADKNGDGALTPEDSFDNDGVDYNGNPSDYDVIKVPGKDENGDPLLDENGDPIYVELEKTPTDTPDIPQKTTLIEFSAQVCEWENEIEAYY